MKLFKLNAWTAVLLLLSGCSSGNRAIPILPPTEAIESAVQQANSDAIFQDGQLITEKWWLIFDDFQLNELIEKTFARNPTLQSAQAQIMAATYYADKVRSALYPSLNFDADVSRQKLSKTGVIPFNSSPAGTGTLPISVPTTPGAASGIPVYFTLYELNFNLKYHFDFWNKNKNTLRAALGQVQANIAEEAFSRLQLGIAVAEVYYQLQINFEREEIAKLIVENRLNYKNTISQRIQANLDDSLSEQRAEFNLSDARDFLLQIQGDIAVLQYQLMAYVAGTFDEQIALINVTQKPLPKVSLPDNLPLHLIARRPDITAQLWIIESAGREIDVAKAGFYPDFNIAALFGFQSIHLNELFKWPSRYFNVDPAVTLPIFDGGLLIAALHESEVNYDIAILKYNDLVLNATKEVLDAIAILRNSSQRLTEFVSKYQTQKELSELVSLRVAHSLSNNLDELVSQENMLIAQDQEISAQGNTIQAVLELIKALGGGFENDNCEG